ncbi:MAG TPA: hypothetical protein VEX68_16835 [Bryobacteraceae bacterium]|nr:hypothetical protein [Bryobacteraceae bacterium]
MRLCFLAALVFVAACGRAPEVAERPKRVVKPAKVEATYDAKFWSLWGDGKAELNAYRLTMPRYKQIRKGVAVTIFVTEPFSNTLRVKADPGRHGPGDEFPVMKLNLVKDYQTGIYDYNDMLSAFVSLAPVNNRPSGVTKLSFSSQEWCGHVYSQVLFGETKAQITRHSYFDGEADQQRDIDYPDNGFTEDTLMLWARGMTRPFLRAGVSNTFPLLMSLETSRARHEPLQWSPTVLTRDAATQSVRVPAGSFEVEVVRAKRRDGSWKAFYVEKESPRRVVRWQSSEGENAELLGSERLKYWEMNGEGGEAALARLGVSRMTPPQFLK